VVVRRYFKQMSLPTSQLSQHGYIALSDLIEPKVVDAIARRVDRILAKGAGTRRLLDIAWCREPAEQLMADCRRRLPERHIGWFVSTTNFTLLRALYGSVLLRGAAVHVLAGLGC
jgi:hypothetical protein